MKEHEQLTDLENIEALNVSPEIKELLKAFISLPDDKKEEGFKIAMEALTGKKQTNI